MVSTSPAGSRRREATDNEATPFLEKNGWRTISLAGPEARAAGAVLVWSVAFVPSKEGCRGRHVEAAPMTPTVVVAQWSRSLLKKPVTTSTIVAIIMVDYGKTYMRLHQCGQFGCSYKERMVY